MGQKPRRLVFCEAESICKQRSGVASDHFVFLSLYTLWMQDKLPGPDCSEKENKLYSRAPWTFYLIVKHSSNV